MPSAFSCIQARSACGLVGVVVGSVRIDAIGDWWHVGARCLEGGLGDVCLVVFEDFGGALEVDGLVVGEDGALSDERGWAGGIELGVDGDRLVVGLFHGRM